MSIVAVLWLIAGVMYVPIVFRICTYWWFPRRATRELEKVLLMKPTEHFLWRDGDKPLRISWLRSRRHGGYWVLAYRQWPEGTTTSGLMNLAEDIEHRLHCSFRAWKNGKFLYCEFGTTLFPDRLEYDTFKHQHPLPSGTLVARCGMGTHGLLAPDLATIGTLLVAGQRGGGKSVMLRTMITDLVTRYEPHQLRLALVDLKSAGVEFGGVFKELPHLVAPIARGSLEEARDVLLKLLREMQRRNLLFVELGVEKLAEYNARVPLDSQLPWLALFIDEYAELAPGMVPNGSPEKKLRSEIEAMTGRLAKLSRNAGILLVVATQRPESNVLPLQFRDQFMSTMCFRMREKVSSRIVLGNEAAANLPPIEGRFVYQSGLQQMVVQAPLLRMAEARKLVDPLRRRALPPAVLADAIEGEVVEDREPVAATQGG